MTTTDRDAAFSCILAGMKADWTAESNISNTESNHHHSILEDTDSESEGNDREQSIDEQLALELKGYSLGKTEEMTLNPLEYWRHAASQFPHLAMQAQKLLCVPATSIPCERLFSAAGILVNKHRSSLRPDHIQEMLCLQSWME